MQLHLDDSTETLQEILSYGGQERLLTATRTHPRFHALLELNDNIYHEIQICKWTDRQQELQAQGEETGEATEEQKKFEGEGDKIVWHYPWNSTGLMRQSLMFTT